MPFLIANEQFFFIFRIPFFLPNFLASVGGGFSFPFLLPGAFVFFEYVSHFLPLFYSVSSFGRSYFDFFPNHFPFSVYLFIFGWPFIYAYRIYLVRVPGSNNTRQALRAPSPSIYRKHSKTQPALHNAAKHVCADQSATRQGSRQWARASVSSRVYRSFPIVFFVGLFFGTRKVRTRLFFIFAPTSAQITKKARPAATYLVRA